MPSQTNHSRHDRRTQKTRLLAIGAMFACLALIFSYIEAIIPFNAGIPGVKLGAPGRSVRIA